MVTLTVTYKPGHSRWADDRTRTYTFSSQDEADQFLIDYADDLEAVQP